MKADGDFWRSVAEVLLACVKEVDDPKMAMHLQKDYEAIIGHASRRFLADHPVLRALRDPKRSTESTDPAAIDLRPLFRLDPTQAKAVRSALSGKPLTVIDGPPGCGKSQVVAALMYECWVRGKSALFVSSKHNPLDVVTARIRETTDEPLIVGRHVSKMADAQGDAAAANLEKCWEKLSRQGVDHTRPRRDAFPGSDLCEIEDVERMESLQRKLETYAPDAIDESMQVVKNAALRVREAREAAEREDESDRRSCEIGTIVPRDPADAMRVIGECRRWIDGFAALLGEVESMRMERAMHAERARELRDNAAADQVFVQGRLQGLPGLDALRSCVVAASRLCHDFEANLGEAEWIRNATDASGRFPATDPRDRGAPEARLHGIKACMAEVDRIECSPEWRDRKRCGQAEDRLKRLCERLDWAAVPDICLQDGYRAELGRRLANLRDAEKDLTEASAAHSLIRMIPSSRWRTARKRQERARRELGAHIARILGSQHVAPERIDHPGSAELEVLAGELLAAPELVDGSICLARLRREARDLRERAMQLGCPDFGGGLNSDKIRELKRCLQELWERGRVALARDRLEKVASEAGVVAARLESSGIRGEAAHSAESSLRALCSGAPGDLVAVGASLRQFVARLGNVQGMLDDAERAEQWLRSIPEPVTIHRDWLQLRPDSPGSPVDVPSIDDPPASGDLYRERIARIERNAELWESRRQERASKETGIRAMEDEARRALERIEERIPSETLRRLGASTRGRSVRDWDVAGLMVSLKDATPVHFAEQIEEIFERIKLHERAHIQQALPMPIGKPERDALKRLGRSTARDSGPEHVANFRTSLNALPLIVATTYKTDDRIPMAPNLFDMVIVDEASTAQLMHVFPAIVRAKALVVIGDPNQLPPAGKAQADLEFACEQACRSFDLDREELRAIGDPADSLYDVVSGKCRDAGDPPLTLASHYRSHPAIIGFANKRIYGSALVLKRHPSPSEPLVPAGVFAIHCPGNPERQAPESKTWRNSEQASWIVRRIAAMRAVDQCMSIGVVSPYKTQGDEISDQLKREHESGRIAGRLDVLASTIHSFQGMEFDHVFFTVPGDPDDADFVRWVSDERLLNVAVTRARKSLTVVADLQAMEKTGGPIGELARFAVCCDRLRRTSRGAHELYCWMLLEGIDCEGEPVCKQEEEQVIFRVRDHRGAAWMVVVAPTARAATLAANAADNLIEFVGKDIMRSPRSAIGRLCRLLRET